jgi:hypothetical protein
MAHKIPMHMEQLAELAEAVKADGINLVILLTARNDDGEDSEEQHMISVVSDQAVTMEMGTMIEYLQASEEQKIFISTKVAGFLESTRLAVSCLLRALTKRTGLRQFVAEAKGHSPDVKQAVAAMKQSLSDAGEL